MTTETTNYLAAETGFAKIFGLKVGSQVKVMRKAKDREAGWANSWNSKMDKSIGKTLTVSRISPDGYGVLMNDSYYYPFFTLEVVQPKDTSIKLMASGSSYTAVINGATGVVKVGCQVIQPETVKAIYEASQKALKANPAPIKAAPKKKATKKVAAKKVARR